MAGAAATLAGVPSAGRRPWGSKKYWNIFEKVDHQF
jgi:hypothetical protein